MRQRNEGGRTLGIGRFRALRFRLGGPVVTVLTAMLVLGSAGGAQANPFGPTYANGPTHRYYLDSTLIYAHEYNTRQAMTYSLGPTIMNPVEVTSISSTTDVVVRAQHVSSGEKKNWYAWATCNSKTGNVCTRWTIVYNTAKPHGDYRAVACHEIGHTVGLGHHPASEENSNFPSNQRSCLRASPDNWYYADHDKAHLNSRYGS